MKIFNLPALADLAPGGDYKLGPSELGSDSVSMLYARLLPNGPSRTLGAGTGTETVVLVLKGEVKVSRKKSSFSAASGEAFHIEEGEEFTVENRGSDEAVLVAATGRTAGSSASPAGGKEPTDKPARQEPHLETVPGAEAPSSAPAASSDDGDDGEGFVISGDDDNDDNDDGGGRRGFGSY